MVFHIIVSILLVLIVLMQSSKGEGLAGTSFAGGVGGAVFGGRGVATFLSKATTILAFLFMFNCGALAYMSSQGRRVVNPADITTSTVTEQAQREREEQMAAQQAAQQQRIQDSLNRLQTLPADTGAGTTTP